MPKSTADRRLRIRGTGRHQPDHLTGLTYTLATQRRPGNSRCMSHNPEVAGSTPAPAAASTRVVPSCSVEWPVGDAHLVRILSLRRNRCETNCFGTDATLGSTAGGSRSRYESSSLVERHGNAVIVISAAARRAARRRSEILDTTVRKCQRQFVVKLHPVVLMS